MQPMIMDKCTINISFLICKCSEPTFCFTVYDFNYVSILTV